MPAKVVDPQQQPSLSSHTLLPSPILPSIPWRYTFPFFSLPLLLQHNNATQMRGAPIEIPSEVTEKTCISYINISRSMSLSRIAYAYALASRLLRFVGKVMTVGG